jgi:hypothetical protein
VTVSLVNPFTAGFDITSISSNVTSHGLYLGSINTATNFNSAGKSTTKPPVSMNYDPPTLFMLTRVLAVQAGLDPTQLDGIVALGGISMWLLQLRTRSLFLSSKGEITYTRKFPFSF